MAARFAGEGGIVVVHGSRESDDLTRSYADVSELSPKSIRIVCNLADSDSIGGMFATIEERFGTIDVLVNNAAKMAHAPFLEMSEDAWDEVLAVNLKAPFLCSQLAAKLMMRRDGGSIINIGSVHEYAVKRNDINYSSAKGGLVMLTKNMALELAEYHIRVNQIAAGAIATDMTPPERQRALHSAIPAARMGTPEEIAALACFLASNEADYISGASIVADGGLTLGFSANLPNL